MSGYSSGLGFAILSIVLLFSWLAVAVFVSAELAFVIGLAITVIWAIVFLPTGFIRELIWQSRQKKIIQAALSEQAPAYQPGSALPPPQSGNALSVISSSTGGALDIYRDDLPKLLPKLEPRDHLLPFKRSLVLPVLGILMMIGANNDTLMQKLLEARGMMNKADIAWEKLTLPPTYQDKKPEMEQAARMALRREGRCTKISEGHLSALTQFRPAAAQNQEISDDKYVYEFTCQTVARDLSSFLVWVSPEDLDRGNLSSLSASFSSRVRDETAIKACGEAVRLALVPLGVAPADKTGTPAGHSADSDIHVFPAKMPFADYVRVLSIENITKNGMDAGKIASSCWVDAQGKASVRFSRIAP